MNWRALLLQNQWFQLCLLVAVLSAGVMIYNLAQHVPNDLNLNTNNSNPNSSPTNQNNQRRVVSKISPKKKGNWTLDASNARDSDGSDLESVAASLSDGDVVTLRPGTYTANFSVEKNVRFVGPAGGKASVTIRASDSQRAGISVSAKKVSFENLTLSYEAAGEMPALEVQRNAEVDLLNSAVSTQSKFGIVVDENAMFTAQDDEIHAVNAGCCLKFQATARGALTRSHFLAGRWGVEAVNASQVQGSGCSFENIGLLNGAGLVVSGVGGRVSVTLDNCQFTGNNGSVLADEGATLRLTNSAFRNNGVTGEQQYDSTGMICAQHGSHIFLTDDAFDENRQGIVVLSAATLALERVKMHGTGIVTENQALRSFCNAIGANEQGSSLTAAHCEIADSRVSAFFISGGATAKIWDTTISNSSVSAFVLGFSNTAASIAELTNVRVAGSHDDGIYVVAGSQLTMQNCQVSNSDQTGIAAQDANTQIKMAGTTVNGCQVMGVDSSYGATLSAIGCTFEQTTRGAQAGLPNDSKGAGTALLENCTVRGNSVFGVGACRGALLVMKGGFLGGNAQNSYHDNGGTVRLIR